MGFRFSDYDVIVIGGGHAGIEAALASARMDMQTLLITQSLDTIGRLSCNPSIGGISKGNIVREIDALGGEMGRLADATMIQYRLLNQSKGPAVQAPRIQADKYKYAQLAKQTLELEKNLHLYQDTVVDIIATNRQAGGHIHSGVIQAVLTSRGREISAKAIVLTTGTFMEGRVFIGEYEASSGRLGEPAANGLGPALGSAGFTIGRLKTGTPPRVLRQSIDFSVLEEQQGDAEMRPFSFSASAADRPAVSCYLTYTNEKTHAIIRDNIHRSPLYAGRIQGVGPRYCPSIEDKVVRFSERERHQIFLEPEGIDTEEFYVNGLSSSLPEEIQDEYMRTVPGLENAVITRPGYAVEYDYLDPTQLSPTLETKRIRGLFTAGQTNGTSGYEEAGGQGLVAGINAALYARAVRDGKTDASGAGIYEPFVLGRSEAYIGVLIDDLVTLGTKEPYRMFTARAEYRLRLRHDTADERLTEKAWKVGLQRDEAVARLTEKLAARSELTSLWKAQKVTTENAAAYSSLEKHVGKSCADALRDPHVPLEDILALNESFRSYSPGVATAAELEIRYEHYIEAQDRRIDRLKKMEGTKIPSGFDYDAVSGLSMESKTKLKQILPATLGQASRISGLRTSDIMLLMIYLR
ncbi:tRNA uridine-5-carboxymethylaminomethyl(34) synthesis enzyme MnmG [Brucepastera parasyntrophica]|uniref:tRNA uridine-5-carboxymethylaminomethyl(34) synthesis enzyme MnmG n=1 Tax=Brucepastera parasyntrophica TaxID=2880008 RepID=UPI00210E4009|nr:tRNA uridine-5-carboxymethylaminomethyl(34) synthesis enzyme MnmG [Brucepastera parasyntrophica]ULQ61083.1 tRNA uridine-5-carboxymethylaminomethyl(34) synthesis enzyme MnmG [Brucepastera parasyntrophica]